MKINWHSLTPVAIAAVNLILSPQMAGVLPRRWSTIIYTITPVVALLFPKLLTHEDPDTTTK